MVVTGEVDEASIWTNSGAQVGDTLVLTKALGTGVVATAIKKGLEKRPNHNFCGGFNENPE
ncbi:MAG: hypothetical protein Ct9H300mP9_4400 [Candidatus Neomarinimicrobiota bacterium]|nr:MAG: hypothetical protein Ct9H300mP9_4400 [Candidatus Neomarinimicrobiota bacterium]